MPATTTNPEIKRRMNVRILLLIQSRGGTHEFVLRPDVLNLSGAILIGEQMVGQVGERLLVAIGIEEDGIETETLDVMASVTHTTEGVGTHVRFEWDESDPHSRARLEDNIRRFGLLAESCDYPLTAFAIAVGYDSIPDIYWP